ncbi:MAG TPA: HIT domain-containing protein [Candidatus Dormibacteraeota bacterium]
MEHLYAPWRMEYIGREEPDEGCLFCRLLARPPEQDRETLVVSRDGGVLIVLNRFPYNSGHLMVAPHAHLGGLELLGDEASLAVMRGVQQSLRALREVLKPEGFNIGVNQGRVAGAGIPDHVHVHIVPRWGGDTNFMPVLGEVKVVNEHLARTWEKLSPAFSGPAS